MDRLIILTDVYIQMVRYCLSQKPFEACGFLSGYHQMAKRCWIIRNIERSPVSFTMDDGDMEAALRQMEENHEELCAVFHSHPTGPPIPSEFDIEHIAYPCSFIIVSLMGIRPRVRSYRIAEGTARQEQIHLVNK